jgi:hypothetical protein
MNRCTQPNCIECETEKEVIDNEKRIAQLIEHNNINRIVNTAELLKNHFDSRISVEKYQIPNSERPINITDEEYQKQLNTYYIRHKLYHFLVLDSITKDPIPNTKSSVRKDGKFRFQNMLVHLTFSYQFDERKYLEYINEKLKKTQLNLTVDKYSIVKEFGKRKVETGEPYPHLHAALMFSKPFASAITDPRYFDYLEEGRNDIDDKRKHPNITVIRKANWDYICNTYHKKQGIPFTNYESLGIKKVKTPITLEDLRQCKTEIELCEYLDDNHVLEKYSRIKEPWEIAMNKNSEINENNKLFRPEALYSWQQIFINIIENEMYDDRTITWCYNNEGSCGKSVLTGIIATDYNGCILSTTDCDSAVYAIQTFIKQHGYPPIIIFDISRTLGSQIPKTFYGLLESLKGGIITSSKYKSSIIRFPKCPNVWVFSNHRPIIENLTLDRWNIILFNYNGKCIDFIFEGAFSKILTINYNELEYEKHKIAHSEGVVYNPCIIDAQLIPVNYFNNVMEILTPEKRIMYWDKGVIPIISIDVNVDIDIKPRNNVINLRNSNNNIIKINERPMTDDEKKEYETWKLNKINSKGEPVFLDFQRKLNICKEKSLDKFRETLNTKK